MANREMLLVSSKVKAYIKSKGGKTSGDFLDSLNDVVYMMVDRALERSKGNKRTTVKGQDA